MHVRLCPSLLLAGTIGVIHPALSTTPPVVQAQAAASRETFDAASIKPTQVQTPTQMRAEPSGLTATNITALGLIAFAHQVKERDVVGELPGWTKTMRFDVVARSANGPLTPRRLWAMTRALLEDRFGMESSPDQATGPVFSLVVDRADGRTGPNLKPSASKCLVDAPLKDLASTPQTPGIGDNCGIDVGFSSTWIIVSGARVTMQEYAAALSRYGGYDRPVVDRTGLTGWFDVAAMTSPDMVAPTRQALLLIALREQLGLTLRGEEGTYPVLRIRRIQQPSAN